MVQIDFGDLKLLNHDILTNQLTKTPSDGCTSTVSYVSGLGWNRVSPGGEVHSTSRKVKIGSS